LRYYTYEKAVRGFSRFHVHSQPAFRYIYAMEVTLDLPDELSTALAGSGQDLPRAALEAMALEAYRERKLTLAQLRRLLGFESRYELDGFLKKHKVWLDYTWEDLEQDRETHRRLGF
jgi:predicted HTH domain antitoxin